MHHQGGGWCEGYADCVARSLTDLGSSKAYPPNVTEDTGYFSTDATTNPLMSNWNMVLLKYCDGASFSGNNATVNVDPATGTKLWFRGARVRALMQQSLFAKGLAKATELVVGGCSAGGLATYLHTDQWCDALKARSPGAKCVGMPDSGFFLDFQDPRAKPFTAGEGGALGATNKGNYHDGLKWVFELQNATSGVSADCIAAFPEEEQYRCMFAEHSAVYQHTPFFPLQSKYDSWQTHHVLYDSSPPSVNTLGANITSRLLALSKANKGWGGFIDACHHHCGFWDRVRIDGDLVGDAMVKWYAGVDDPTAKKVWNEDNVYPCDTCCKADPSYTYTKAVKSDCNGRDIKPQPSCGGNRNLSVAVLEKCCGSTRGCGGFNTHGVIKDRACAAHINPQPTTDLYLINF